MKRCKVDKITTTKISLKTNLCDTFYPTGLKNCWKERKDLLQEFLEIAYLLWRPVKLDLKQF